MSIIELQHEQPVGATDADAGVLKEPARHEVQLPEQNWNQNDESNAPPDGGLQAWLQVVASFFLYFNHLYALQQYISHH
ncbi:hypothetical protein V8C26DRAFT_401425 [Trichoderma gracile]